MADNLVGLRTLLADDPDIADLVGDRIGPPGTAQAEVYPQIALSRINRLPDRDLSGETAGDDADQVMVMAMANTLAEAAEIGAAVIAAADGYRGLLDNDLRWVFLEADYHDFSPPEDGGGQGIYLWVGNFLVTPV